MKIIISHSENVLETGHIVIGSVSEKIELHITLSKSDIVQIMKNKSVAVEV